MKHTLERLLGETEREVAAHWRAVEAVASALLARVFDRDGALQDHRQVALSAALLRSIIQTRP